VLAGALLIGVTAHNPVGYVLAFIASFFAAANVVGGYVVTERMLKMFRRKVVAPSQPGPPSQPGQPELESLNGHKGLRGLADKIGRAQS
jgi:NAD/NADP transhydrogenase alpha subunit